MRKINEILRLKWQAGLSHAKIARAVGLSKGAVAKYVSLAAAQGIGWPTGLSQTELEARLFPAAPPVSGRVEPDFAAMHTELKRKGVTLQLLWSEYVAAVGDGAYRYSQYCQRYRDWRARQRAAYLPYWLHDYNWHRPHASLNHQPPVSRLGLDVNNVVGLHS